MNVIKTQRRKLQIFIYQKIADHFVWILSKLPKNDDDKMFGIWFDMAMNFNDYCVEKEIYLN
jgi:hypothetical protein